jgi:hypothetical protein
MQTFRSVTPLLTALLLSSTAAHADDCEALTRTLTDKMTTLSVAGRQTADDQSQIVTFRHEDADEVSLTCAPDQPFAHLSAVSSASWPPSRFYDLLAAMGSITTSISDAAVRSGAILCAQRALREGQGTATFEANDLHFQCQSTTGVGAATKIEITKMKPAVP